MSPSTRAAKRTDTGGRLIAAPTGAEEPSAAPRFRRKGCDLLPRSQQDSALRRTAGQRLRCGWPVPLRGTIQNIASDSLALRSPPQIF